MTARRDDRAGWSTAVGRPSSSRRLGGSSAVAEPAKPLSAEARAPIGGADARDGDSYDRRSPHERCAADLAISGAAALALVFARR